MAAAIVKKLEAAAYAYYETDEPIMTDAEYDELVEKLRAVSPDHKFFDKPGPQPSKGRVDLPCPMPSLKKIKPDSWASWKRQGPFVISEKLDGISALWASGIKGALYLRGDGLVGQNVSHVIPKIKGLVSKMGQWLIRGELIAKASDVEDTLARNWTNGILHQDEPKTADLAKIHFVAYQVIEPRGLTRQQQFDWLANQGFETAWHKIVTNLTLEDLSAAFKDRKANSTYTCDGLVIGTNNVAAANKDAKEPDDAVAYKEVTSDQCKETTVLEVEWNASKTGTYIPRLRLKPVLIGSASIQYCTAFNAKFVEENKIGKGTTIILRRSGDVIPTIDRVVKNSGKADMPTDGTWVWDDTKTHAKLKDAASNVSVMAKGLVHSLTTLGIEGFREASALTLCEAGITSLGQLLKTDKGVLQGLLGNVLGERLIDSLKIAVCRATEDVWISAAPCWPKGYSKTKLLAVYKVEPDINKWGMQTVMGISPNGMQVIKNAVPLYLKWRESVGISSINKVESVHIATPQIKGSVCLTGFRDPALSAKLEAAGYSVSDSVTKASKALFVSDLTKTSGKIESAKKHGIKIISRANADSFFV
jgi:DNA ligase (NAD+)